MLTVTLQQSKGQRAIGTEWEALALVRDLAGGRPESHAFSLVGGGEDDEDPGGVVAAGRELLARARMGRPMSA